MYVLCIFLHILNADYMQMGNVFGDTIITELVAEQIELWKSRRKDEKFTSWTPRSWLFVAISEGKILLICPVHLP